MKLKILPGEKMLQIQWDDDHISKFHASWIRLNCDCTTCQGTSPGCFDLDVTQFPEELFIRDAELNKDENLIIINFRNEPYIDHVTTMEPDRLRRHCYCDVCLKEKISRRDALKIIEGKPKQVPLLDYNDSNYNSDDFYFRWMKAIFDFGFCQVINFPSDDESFKQIAGKLGDLENSPYTTQFMGEIGNLVDGEKNSGNTTKNLPFHMDFMYLDSIGQIMLHNCVRFDPCVTGGESIILDGFEAAETLRRESPKDFKILTEIPVLRENVTKNKFFGQLERACITTDYRGEIVGLCFAGDHPPLVQVPGNDVEKFFKAYRKFYEILKRRELQTWFKHRPGAVVAFNNRRMIHSRTEIHTNGGVRYFKELCVRFELTRSNYMKLADKLGIEIEPPKIGNYSAL